MTTAAMSVTQPRTAHGLERVTVVLLLCFAASLQISIAAAQHSARADAGLLGGAARPGSDAAGRAALLLAACRVCRASRC